MRKPTPVNMKLVRSMNMELLLKTLVQLRKATKSQLAKLTELSFPTVSKLIADLESTGLVISVEEPSSTVGRPSTTYQLNPKAGTLVAVDISTESINLVAIDLLGNKIDSQKINWADKNPPTPNEVIGTIRQFVSRLENSPRGVCLSIPGLIDHTDGTVRRCLSLGWGRVPLGEIMKQELGMPVMIENDAVCGAVGEMHALGNNCQQDKTFIYITISRGIGAGIIVNGQILRGTGSQPGSLGHTIIDASGSVKCQCGNVGCLEALVGQSALAEAGRRMGLVDTLDDAAGIFELIAKAEDGNLKAISLLKEAGRSLAIGIHNLVLTIAVEEIVIGGALGQCSVFLNAVRSRLAELNPIHSQFININSSRLFPNESLRGACFLAQRAFIESLINGQYK